MKELVGKIFARLHILLLLYAAYSFYLVYSEHEVQVAEILQQRPSIEDDIKKAEQKLSQIDDFRKNVDQTKLRVNEVFSNIEKVQRQLPAEVNDIEILDYLSKEGKALNMPEMEPNPIDEQPMGFYIAKPYSVKARGTFLQFVVFLERINAAERLFNVRNFTISSPAEVQKGRFQVVSFSGIIDTFKFNSVHKESSGIEEIESQFKADGSGGRKNRKQE